MIDPDALAMEVKRVSIRMRSHGGGIELTSVDQAGRVVLRFTGMCCGCPYKALCWHGTVEPMLSAIAGVTALDAPGVRISEEAAARLRASMSSTDLPSGETAGGGG